MMYEVYGYAIEVYNRFLGKEGDYGGYWDRYNRKVYDSEEKAKRAIEENPYYPGTNGWMDSYKIITLYSLKGER